MLFKMQIMILWMTVGIAMSGARVSAQRTELPEVQTVDSVDLMRYAGRWHEVARFPNRFQDNCARNTTADYTLLDNGQITVVNQCEQSDGSIKRAEGRAKLARSGGSTARLKVRFAPRILSWLPMVWGDYWILDLTSDYTAVLVGSPNREYLWILARSATIDEATYQRMVETATKQGFDVSRLVRSASMPE